MIEIHKEPEGLHLERGGFERCVFCGWPTAHWHLGTNNPVCETCAPKHDVSELKNWFKKEGKNEPH